MSRPAAEPKVPAQMLNERRKGWHWFTQMILWHSVGLAIFLVLLLLFFKVL